MVWFERISHSVPLYIRHPGGDKSCPNGNCKCLVSRERTGNTIIVTEESNKEPEYSLKLVVVMGRIKDKRDRETVIRHLKQKGLKISPYSKNECIGYYTRNIGEAESVAVELKRHIDVLAIVNTVWYIYIDKRINLRPLIDRGFLPSTSLRFKTATGSINGYAVRFYRSGAIQVTGALLPSEMPRMSRNILYFLESIGAVE